LGGGEAFPLERAHAPNACLVLLGVEAEAAGRARRIHHVVARLPRAQERWGDARPAGELADPKAGVTPFHADSMPVSLQTFNKHLTNKIQLSTVPRQNFYRKEL